MASENNVSPPSANAMKGTQSRRFSPSAQSANVMSDSNKSFYPDAWSIWREMPVFDRHQIWNHFKTECTWNPRHEYQIFCNFEKQAADMFYCMLWTSWKNNQKPYFIPEGIWARLDEKWTTEKFQKTPRASNKGDSLNIRTSDSIGTHGRKLEKEKGRTMTYDEVFEEKHVKNKKDGHRTLVEPLVERTNVGCKKSLDECHQSEPTSEDDSKTQSSHDDEASILPEAIGGIKKGEAHGVGSQRCLGCQEKIDSLQRQVQELSKKQKRNRLRFARLENLVQDLIDFCPSDDSDYDSDDS